MLFVGNLLVVSVVSGSPTPGTNRNIGNNKTSAASAPCRIIAMLHTVEFALRSAVKPLHKQEKNREKCGWI